MRAGDKMKRVAWLRWLFAAALAMGALCPRDASAQAPARFYWKTLSNARGVPVILNSLSGNANPFDPSQTVNAGGNVDATMAIVGYAHYLPLFNRTLMAAVLVPVGQLSGEVFVDGKSLQQAAGGFGDPMLELDYNIIGPPAQNSLPDALRYEPGFTVDVLGDLAFPIGEYNSSQALNLGQHRWYGRLGLPILGQLGPWVPGRRTTLELLPAVWLFGPNNDYVGKTLHTEPLFQLDAHLTRDLTEHFWAAIDGVWYVGGKASVDGTSGKMRNNVGVGFTLGYQINDNLNATFGYKATVADKAEDALHMSAFMFSLVFGWHPLLEGVRRLQGAK
jgi:hypothetical protein